MKLVGYYSDARCHAVNTDVTVKSVSPHGLRVTVTGVKAGYGDQYDYTYCTVWSDHGVPSMTFVYKC